jgi:hypothetical protein
MLSTTFLIPAYLIAISVICSIAPLIIVNEDSEPIQVSLVPADATGSVEGPITAEKDKPARFHEWTGLLGRPFVVEVKGYVPKTIEIAAPVGITISPRRDLNPRVAILVRPTPAGMSELLSGGTLHVFREGKGRDNEIAADAPQTRASLLVGAEPVALPHDLAEDWRLELAGQRSLSEESRANVLRWWKNPHFVKINSQFDDLTPHQKLKIVLHWGDSDVEGGSLEIPVASGPVVDLPLRRYNDSEP